MQWDTDNLHHSQLQVLFLLAAYGLSTFGYKKYNQSDFGIEHLLMSMCKVASCVVEKGFAMTSAFSWQNSASFYPASFCSLRPNLPVTPGISWLPTLAFQFPVMNRISFLVLVLEGLVGLHRTDQLQLLQHPWLGHRLGWCDVEQLALETNRDHSVIFEVAPEYFGLSCWLWGLLHFFYWIPAHSSRYNGHPFPSISVHWFLGCRCLFLPSPAWPRSIYLDSWT